MEDIWYLTTRELKVEKVSFVSVIRNQNHTFETKNGKALYSFVYIDSGSSEYCFKGKFGRITATKGEMIFVPKGIPYKATYLKDNTHIKMICFDTPDDLGFENRPFVKKTVEIATEFSKANQEQLQDSLYLSSLIYKFLYILSNEENQVPKRFKKIAAMVKEIEVNYFENRKISYYAALSDMSESNFRRLFKEYTGKSVIEYRNEIRISEVNKMLLSGEYNVNEAAFAAGFNNMSFFYELYRKYNKVK